MRSFTSLQLRRSLMGSQSSVLATRSGGFQFQYPHGFQNTNNAYLNIPTEQVE